MDGDGGSCCHVDEVCVGAVDDVGLIKVWQYQATNKEQQRQTGPGGVLQACTCCWGYQPR